MVLLKAAKTYLELDETDKAREKLRRAVQKNPGYETPFVELAKLVEPEEAVTLLLEANTINPFDPRIHELLTANYRKRGDNALAEQEEGIFNTLKK